MKLNKALIAFSFLFIGLTGCNTDDLEKDIDALKDRVASMETQVQALNESMNILRIALEGNKTIQKCTDNGDGSLTLLLSDGSSINLTQGVEGSEFYPTISIDGDGFWMIDGVKQEYKAKAEDGQDGKTPKFRLDSEGDKFFWAVSFDDGKTFEPLLDTDGNRVQANVEDSIQPSNDGPITNVEVNGNSLKFSLDGNEYSIPIVEGLKCIVTIPDESKEGEYCIVSTKTQLELDIEVSGEYCLVNAPAGWSASVNRDKTKLTIIAPEETEKEGIIILQVNKGINWAVEKIKVKSRYVVSSLKELYDNGSTLNIAGLEVNKNNFPNANLIDNSSENKILSTGGLYFITADAENVTCKVETQAENLIIISDTPNKKAQIKFVASAKVGSETNLPTIALFGMEVDFTNMTKSDYFLLGGNKAFNIFVDECKLTLGTRNLINVKQSESNTFDKFYIKNSEIKYHIEGNSLDISGKHLINIANTAQTKDFGEIVLENNLIYNSSPSIRVLNFCVLSAVNVTAESVVLKNNTFINMQSSYSNSNRGYVYCKNVKNVSLHKNIIWFDHKMANVAYSIIHPSSKHTGAFDVKENIGYSKEKNSEKGEDTKVNIQLFYGSYAPDGIEPLQQLQESPLNLTDRENGVYTITNDLYKDYGYLRK